MFKKIDVIFFVEHKDRELDSYKGVAKILKERYNISSLIISNFFHSYLLWIYRPKLIVWNNLTDNEGWPNGFIWNLYKDDLVYISHRWEQLLSPVNFKFKAPKHPFEKEKVKLFVWNENFKEYLISNGVKKENIFVVGNIANNLLFNMKDKKEEFREIFSKKFNLNKTKKWIFLPMNYNWAFFTEEMVKRRIQNGYDEKIAWEYREYARKSLKEFIFFVNELSKKNYEIILRPHPSITEDDYKKVFKEVLGFIPKILINKDYSVREWIISSDIIGSSWSTSVWDAYQIGKKAFYFTPFKRPEWLDTFWMREVENIKNIKEFEEFEKKESKSNKVSSIDTMALENFSKTLYNLLPNDYPKIHNIEWKYIKNFYKYFIKDKLCKYFNCFKIPKWQHYDYFEWKEVKNGKN